MDTFDRHTLRDPAYRARFQAKLAEIKAVRAKHTFIDYATHQNLFEDLQQIYQENLDAYQHSYIEVREEFQQAKSETEAHKAEMHPIRYRNARRLYENIEQLLRQTSYEENRKARDIIEQLRHHTDISRKEMREWEEVLSNWDLALKGKITRIWTEVYTNLRSSLQQIQAEVRGADRLPKLPLNIDTASIEEAVNSKKKAIDSLRPKAAFSSKYVNKLDQLASTASSKEAFEDLRKQIKKARQGRVIRWAAIVGAVLLLAGSGMYVVPQWMQGQQEDQVWAESQAQHTLQSYQDYLHRYPAGKYVAQAIDARRHLPTGILDSLTDQRGRQFRYEGDLQQLVPQGNGTAFYTNGAIFEGQFNNGLPDSAGTFTAIDGSRYEGSWNNGFKDNGTQHFPNGDRYQGKWKDDLYHGYGTLTLADGSSYSGGWIKGVQEGKGSYAWADGSSYKGQWKAGRFHGKGVYTDSLSIKYDGYFVDGLRQGEGELIWPDSLIFEGAWQADKREGIGTLIWVKTNNRFEVQWEADTINGAGFYSGRKPTRIELTGNWSGTTDNLKFYSGTQLHNTYQLIDHGMIVPFGQ